MGFLGQGAAEAAACTCLHLPAPGMCPSGYRQAFLGTELLRGGVAKRKVVL